MGAAGNCAYFQVRGDTVIAIMFEKKGAVEGLDGILELPGVEMVQWGGSDYSMSIGRVGESQHPDVLAAQEKVFKSAIDKGIPARAEIQSVEQAKKFLDWGVRHFSIGTDISILYNFWRENGDELRKAMSDA